MHLYVAMYVNVLAGKVNVSACYTDGLTIKWGCKTWTPLNVLK
jgi:hypothetical protein